MAVQLFSDLVEQAPTGEKSVIRAIQAWQFLIGKAMNRQIVRYKELQEVMGYPTSNPLASILECLLRYCDEHKLPPLTILVVNQSGIPGAGFPVDSLEDYHKQREKVFEYDWFNLFPPSIEDLRTARYGE